VDFLRGKGCKVILAQGGTVSGAICVHCDEFAAGSIAAAHAYEMGHRRADVIFPARSTPRFDGFVETFSELGGTIPEVFTWIIPLNHRILEREVAAKLAESKNPPSLFYCFADNILFPVIRALAAKGLSVPDDVSLIGTDNLYWGAFNNPAFTTVDLNEELFADKLIEAIGHAERGSEPYQIAVPVRLIERETVRKI
jgi:DNA-binding LacI/PurR family transcriptional regulator